jgi:arylsulfatase A-like enzyme
VADHGEEFFDHGAVGHITTLYQELMHVPLLLKLPHQQAAGTVVKPTWQVIDIAPTLLHQVGLAIPDFMEGKPYVPGGSPGELDRPAFFSLRAGAMAERFKQGTGLQRAIFDGVRVGRWVLIRAYSSVTSGVKPLELYDLETDPTEQRNLVYSRPEVRAWLASVLKAQDSGGTAGTAPTVSPAELESSLRALQYLR